MNIATLCIIILLSQAGCASLTSVQREYGKINYVDGIDKSEAKVIAQHRLITGNSYDYQNIVLSLPHAEEKDEQSWHVSFWPKFYKIFEAIGCSVTVDKQTGEGNENCFYVDL